MRHRRKILAVASSGGHWIELKRLLPAFESVNADVVFASTQADLRNEVEGSDFYLIPDANAKTKARLVWSMLVSIFIVLRVRPSAIVTTGAAPGLLCALAGKIIGARVVWLDSIANADKVSMSCRIACLCADSCLTQWEHLATGSKIKFIGRVL